MTNKIASYFGISEGFVTDLSVEDGYISFRLNGVWMSGKATKTGKWMERYGFWRS